MGPAPRPGLRRRRALPRARHRRLQRRVGHWRPCFAGPRAALVEVDLRGDHGYDVPTAARATQRVPCSACGCRSATCSTRPRATAATTWWPPATTWTTRPRCCSATPCAGTPSTSPASCRCCPARRLPRKVKPLVRLTERETAAYCVLRGIDYNVEECPMAAGNRHLGYKDALNAVEATSPGSKAAFYFGFLSGPPWLSSAVGRRAGRPAAVRSCGAPTTDVCAPSAACRQGPRAPPARSPCRAGAPVGDGRRSTDEPRPVRRGTCPAARPAAAGTSSPLRTAASSTATPATCPTTELIGRREGTVLRSTRAPAVHRPAPDARGLRAEDAARGAGDLPEGPGADPDARRRVPRAPVLETGCRVGRAHR